MPSEALKGAGKDSWAAIESDWAEIEDARPSRADRLGEGMKITRRPARVIMRYREDIQPGWRLLLGARVMLVIAGPAEIEDGNAVEFMVEDYRPGAGSA